MNNTEQTLSSFKKAHRLSNYISAVMLYLKHNFYLEQELRKEDIKDRILGHWGTVPGLNFIYQGLSHAAKKYEKDIMLIAGPGHGAPAILANAFVEGSLSDYYHEYPYSKAGLSKLIHDFSWPGGFPSHTTPKVPGTILEGGELGYSLATAFGAVFDNPDLTVACVIGDGEAETATLAASWHGNKFLNPQKDGAILPILHLNGYRISGPTIFATMSEGEIMSYFKGLGYDPIFVNQYTSTDIYIDYLQALIQAFEKINLIKTSWQNYEISKSLWPVIILKTMKGWTGPESLKGEKIEDNNLSHGIPLQNPKKDETEFSILKSWLKSYEVNELFNEDFIIDEIRQLYPQFSLRLSSNKYSFGGEKRIELTTPDLEDHELKLFQRGERSESRMVDLSKYLREIVRNNQNNDFRVFSPDESESNLLEEMFDVTSRVYSWPLRSQDKFYSKDGKIVEMLSENVLLAMLQGYNLTGRHGLLISYEAFLNVTSSQIDQHIKYLKQASKVKFRKPIPSLNLIATSTLWRQEHNGFTHQNPTLINSILCKDPELVKVYLPSDVNSLLATMEECLKSTNKVNLIIACKRELPQWLNLKEARFNLKNGLAVWSWVDDLTDNEKDLSLKTLNVDIADLKEEPDVILASAGDYQTNETIAAIKLLNQLAPELKIRYININELNKFKEIANDPELAEKYFTKDKAIVINFHGYPDAIKQITWGSEIAERMTILGYLEEGTTTTPFDMEVLNKASRYHVAIEAINSATKFNNKIKSDKAKLIKHFVDKIKEHEKYIVTHGMDLDLD